MIIKVKAKKDIPNYRNAGPSTSKKCKTCKHSLGDDLHCKKYDWMVKEGFVCDSWLPDVSSVREESKAIAQTEKGYSFGSTQINLPLEIGMASLYLGSLVSLDDLAPNGIEEEPHITIQYGLRDDSEDALKYVSDSFSPVKIKFGKLSLFENKDVDVLKIEVDSQQLFDLRYFIRDIIPNSDERFEYHPHLTIAYLKPGTGRKYLALPNPLEGTDFIADEFQYSTSEGEKTLYSLRDWKTYPIEVFKDRNGEYRWISRSSTAFKDRDGQYMSTKALKQAVELNDHTGDYGPLRWWHLKGADFGDCDFQMVHGRTLIESGTFYKEESAIAIKESGIPMGVSIGVKHPKSEPHWDTFNNILIFERSIMPLGKESNKFTGFTVKGDDSMTTEKNLLKVFELVKTLGPDVAYETLRSAETVEKEADKEGHTFKEAGQEFDFETATLDEVIAHKSAMIEAKKAAAEAAKGEAGEEGEKVSGALGEIQIDLSEVTKEVQAIVRTEIEKGFAEISEKSKGPESQLLAKIEQLQEELKELKGEQPRSSKTYRASNDPKMKAETAKATVLKTPVTEIDAVAERMAKSYVTHPYYGAAPDNGSGVK